MRKYLPAVGGCFHRSVCECRLAYGAALVTRKEIFWDEGTSLWVEFGLRPWVDGSVVVWVLLLAISGLVPKWISPGIFGGAPSTARLYGDVVDSSANAEKAVLTPLSSPRVSNIPELLPIFSYTPTDN